MRLSVIVATYNKPAYLEKVLRGLAVQSVQPDEVIVGDDGSGPETGELVKRLTREVPYPLIHYWHEDSGFRLAKTRNEALKVSTGDYIIFLDGDCIPGRHFIEDHRALAKEGWFFQGKRVLVSDSATSNALTHTDVNSIARLLMLMLGGKISNAHHILRIPLPWLARLRGGLRGIRGCNMAFFRKDIVEVNGFNEDFVGWGREDSEFIVRLMKLGLRRREHGFMAICYHLWHEDNARAALPENDAILARAQASASHRCANGLVKEAGIVG